MANQKQSVTRYADGGHSWFKVKRDQIELLGIENKISGCSYQFGDYVYLEEDCDAALYFKAVLGKKENDSLTWQEIAERFNVKENYSNRSRVRTYPNYSPYFRRVQWVDGKRVSLYGQEYIMRIDAISGRKTLESIKSRYNYRVKSTQMDHIKEL